ncbi:MULTISPECIES: prolipoprotein diacylglyceryl transferase [Anaeromyxobacter]|uniref:prolipoprotein diacylglyceryl transferase n=1 Tax=Anaeromyxobacter TaxID=161492 RepID=UPI001F58D32E|nr:MULTISPECIES: prolipoprotein diacylglyceryl transferase [unclassified Anaeromyxobacter]
MHPILLHLVVPAGLGKLVALAVLVISVVGRAASRLRAARRADEPLSVGQAFRADGLSSLALAAAVLALWRAGLLDRGLRLPVHAYGLLIAAAFVIGIWLAQREARRVGQDAERLADLAFWVLVAALAGSRVYFILVNAGTYFGSGSAFVATPLGRIPRVLAIWEGGLVFYGGFIGAALAAALYMRRHRMPFLAHADTLITSVAFGHFLGRLGCFCAGCCWGGLADPSLPWAVRFPPESLAYKTFLERPEPAHYLAAGWATTLPLHPTQLYEAFGELALFLLLALVIRPRKRFHGQVLASWLLAYAVLRTVVELFRGDVERGVYLGLGAGQWTSFLILAVGVAVWVGARKERPAIAAAGAQ